MTRFFCISDAQRQTLIQAGMPADRLSTKPNFVPDRGLRRERPGEYLLYLGRMADEKGVPLLLDAWDRLAASGGLGMPLVLAGAGPLGDEVERWARNRDDASYVGLRDHAESARLVAGAAAVVAPSVWLETFGLVVVEAMAAGVPAVAAAHGAFTELIDDGVCGVLHRPGDAASLEASLRRVVLDTDHNLALGRAARRRYEKRFTPEAGLAALIDGYEAAIGDRHESVDRTRRRSGYDYVDRPDVNGRDLARVHPPPPRRPQPTETSPVRRPGQPWSRRWAASAGVWPTRASRA